MNAPVKIRTRRRPGAELRNQRDGQNAHQRAGWQPPKAVTYVPCPDSLEQDTKLEEPGSVSEAWPQVAEN